jgi:hypothetical protein
MAREVPFAVHDRRWGVFTRGTRLSQNSPRLAGTLHAWELHGKSVPLPN